MDFLEKLNSLMNDRGLNRNTLSAGSGIPYTTIDSFYKKGFENAKLSTIQKLADYFDTTLDYLMRDEIDDPNFGKASGFMFSFQEKNIIEKYRALDTHGHQVVDFLLNAEYDRVQDVMAASRGEVAGKSGTIAVPLLKDALSRKEVGTIPVQPDDEIRKDEDDLFALPVTNDAMAPFVHPGDKLIVRQQSEVDNGDIAVVLLDGIQVVCKQVIKEGDNLRLVPLNKKYEDMVIHKEDIREKRFETIGRVVKSVQAS